VAPLDGLRVLDYGQYVAVPFATMLLADLGADVVKVEAPGGDQWRRYEPLAPGESRHFYALNRNKRSVALDLKTAAGRRASAQLIRGADALVHNCLPERARRFALDRDSVRAVNPRCVCVNVSAFGSTGPDSRRPAYDLISQALSGLLAAQPRSGDAVPRRMGGLAVADFMAGALAAISVVAGLLDRGESARGIEVSLLGAALSLQAQRFVAPPGETEATGPLTARELARLAESIDEVERLDPYYRTYACADGGFVAVSCLNTAQRLAVCALFGLEDPFVEDPQALPAGAAEHAARLEHAARIEARFAESTVPGAVQRLTSCGVPAAEVRGLGQLFTDAQACANGLVQTVEQSVGPLKLLGNVFKVDGVAEPARRGAPGLDEHRAELLADRPG
jgi:crotonobetainyl-CoA:carnitine CoA-transferase CaiB-like acyl-CoA transferase